MPPPVSVVVPCFNVRPYVAGAIESILAQAYPALETVAVDDGSTDGTLEALEAYERRGVITLLRQPNRGAAAARNAGIRASRGELIAFLDADDEYLPGAVERRVAFLGEHPEVAVVYGDALVEALRGRRRHRPQAYPPDEYPRRLFTGLNPIAPSTVMVRRSALDEAGLFDETLPAIEDADLWMRIALCHRIGYLDEPLTLLRRHREGSMTSRLGDAYFATATALTDRYVAMDPSLAALVPARTAQIHRRHALDLLGAFGGPTFRRWDALRALAYAVRVEPVAPATLRAAALWLASWVLGRRGVRWVARRRRMGG